MGWLKAIRAKSCMTQKEVADASGITQPAYNMIENSNMNPSVETAKAIAKVLGFNWTRFFEEEEKQ